MPPDVRFLPSRVCPLHTVVSVALADMRTCPRLRGVRVLTLQNRGALSGLRPGGQVTVMATGGRGVVVHRGTRSEGDTFRFHLLLINQHI